MQQKADAAEHTPKKESERLALNGLDLRLGSRLHHLAQRPSTRSSHRG